MRYLMGELKFGLCPPSGRFELEVGGSGWVDRWMDLTLLGHDNHPEYLFEFHYNSGSTQNTMQTKILDPAICARWRLATDLMWKKKIVTTRD